MRHATRTTDPTLVLLPGWRPVRPPGPDPGIVLAATGPYAAGLVLRRGVTPLPPGTDLEDDDVLDLDTGTVAYLRFSVRGDPDDRLHERWTWGAGPAAVELTCSVARVDHPEVDETLEALAEAVDPRHRG